MAVGEKIKDWFRQSKLGRLIAGRYDVFTMLSTMFSVVVGVTFAIMNLVSAILYKSMWYGSLAIYVTTVLVFRAVIVIIAFTDEYRFADDEERLERRKWVVHLIGGVFLLAVGAAISVLVSLTVMSDRPVSGGIVMAIANATYTFYKIIASIVNMVKAGKRGGPISRALRNLTFADACVSMYSLTALMLVVFGAGDTAFETGMQIGVGAAAVLGVVIVSIIMMARGGKNIKNN